MSAVGGIDPGLRERASGPWPPATAVRATLLALATGLTLFALARLLENRSPLRIVLGPRFELAAVALGASLAAEALAWRRCAVRRGGAASITADLRTAFLAATLTWGAFLVLVHPFQRLWFDLALGIGAGGLAAWIAAEPRIARVPAWFRRALGVTTWSLCVALLLTEVGLRALARGWDSALFARPLMTAAELLDRNRLEPGSVFLGSACNDGGHCDDAFARRRPGERRIATIGDSFSIGVVPRARHYTSVCERELGFPVDNLGASAIGLPEYEKLLVEEALPLDPDLVVIAVFVGNDLEPPPRQELPDARLRSWWDRDNVLIALVPARLGLLAAERDRRGAARVAGLQGTTNAQRVVPADELDLAFPWLADPALEQPTFSPQAFLACEAGRASNMAAASRWLPAFSSAFEALLRSARSTRVAVLLIPDELQVEDDVWTAVLGVVPETEPARDLPQALLVPWFAARGVPCLDLLPLFRAVPPFADGRRHLYHLRDTHWNARGNDVAGRALANFVRELTAGSAPR